MAQGLSLKSAFKILSFFWVSKFNHLGWWNIFNYLCNYLCMCFINYQINAFLIIIKCICCAYFYSGRVCIFVSNSYFCLFLRGNYKSTNPNFIGVCVCNIFECWGCVCLRFWLPSFMWFWSCVHFNKNVLVCQCRIHPQTNV